MQIEGVQGLHVGLLPAFRGQKFERNNPKRLKGRNTKRIVPWKPNEMFERVSYLILKCSW